MARKRSTINVDRDPSEIRQGNRMNDAANEFWGTVNPIRDDEATIKALETQVNNSIVRLDEKRWKFRRVEMTSTQLVLPDDLSEEEANELGMMLSGLDSATQFWKGDWANIYINTEMDQYEAASIYETLADQFHMRKETLKDYAWVCRQIPASLRKDALAFSHHKEIAGLPEELKGREEAILDWAAQEMMQGRLTVLLLRQYIAEQKQAFLPTSKKPILADDNFLFDKPRLPKINKLQLAWSRARNGDQKARQAVQESIQAMRAWLEDIEKSLD